MTKKIYKLGLFLWIVLVPVYAGESLRVLKVADGDSFTTDQNKIRLLGIDAPERADICQLKTELGELYCGQLAKEYLSKMLLQKTIFCEIYYQDRYRRQVAVCFLDKTLRTLQHSINALLVDSGMAVVYQSFLKGKKFKLLRTVLLEKQQLAEQDQRGIWATHFFKVWKKRKKQ